MKVAITFLLLILAFVGMFVILSSMNVDTAIYAVSFTIYGIVLSETLEYINRSNDDR